MVGSLMFFLIFTVGFALFGWLVYESFQHKQKMKTLEAKINDDEKQAIYAELDEMKSRIITLEKIVTDKNYDLRNEIDEL